MKKCVFFIGLSLLLCMGVVKGQATVRGVLFDSSNGEAIPFANVTLVAQDSTLQSRRTYGAATDLGGVFVISKVPTGNYTIRVRYVGYEEIVSPVSVAGSQTLKLKLNMNRSATLLHTVEIRDSRAEERKMQTSVSVEKITARQIEQMPSVGGQSDLAQYLQVLPGVSSTGDQGGQLHIRGGSMIQNLCLLDGMIVYNPFHSIGLYSIFETDMLLNVDVYTGGFGAEYGGRISSVMDITTRDGNKHRHSGSVGLNTFGASAMLEGPLKKETPQSKSTITYILSAKNSYLSKSSKVFYPSIEGGLPFDYMDLYGKLTLNSGTGSKVSLYGFRYDDSVHNYQDVANYHWVNYGLGGRFSVLTGSSAVLDGAVAYSDYRIGLNDVSGLDKYSAINGLNMSFDVTNFFGQNRLKCGMSMESYSTDYLFYNSYKLRTEQQEHTNSISGYGTFRWILDKWILEPGLRYIYYNSLSEGSLEPRLAAKYKCSDKLRLKFSGGMYSQVFLDARSDNDIVNLFSGFLTSVHLNEPATFSGREASSCVRRSSHLVLGVEYDFSPHLTTN
ncbi:MAG: TonB-dependent receptor, partial [Bacteroidales bacterium]|nr:TonB-dependent receptor [Candidatus Colimorpha onthohippi]